MSSLFLKSSGLCLPMLWHVTRQGCVRDNASVHTAGMFSIWTHQLPEGCRARSLKIKHELGFQHCVGFGRHHTLLHYLGRIQSLKCAQYMFNKNHLHGIYTGFCLVISLPLARRKWIHSNRLTLINGQVNMKAIEAFPCLYL